MKVEENLTENLDKSEIKRIGGQLSEKGYVCLIVQELENPVYIFIRCIPRDHELFNDELLYHNSGRHSTTKRIM